MKVLGFLIDLTLVVSKRIKLNNEFLVLPKLMIYEMILEAR